GRLFGVFSEDTTGSTRLLLAESEPLPKAKCGDRIFQTLPKKTQKTSVSKTPMVRVGGLSSDAWDTKVIKNRRIDDGRRRYSLLNC
ncbi:MAG: hypothetical protein AAFR18_21060, partial [Cyanobacteria bacterium J06627_32]